jgi:hypothetical protein
MKLVKKTLGDDMKYYPKLYGLIVFLDMMQIWLLLLSLCMIKRLLCCFADICQFIIFLFTS